MTMASEVRAHPLRLICWVGLLIATVHLLTVGGTYPGIASVQAQIVVQSTREDRLWLLKRVSMLVATTSLLETSS